MSTHDGLDADAIFNAPSYGYNFDDLVSLPGHATAPPDEVDLTAEFSRNLSVSNPIVAAPMDTVTEAPMAIAMALLGGIGVIHANCSAAYQAKQVSKVKSYRNGFIMDPFVLRPRDTVEKVLAIRRDYGVSTVLITENGEMGSKFLGIITSRDIDQADPKEIIEKVMMPRDRMVVAKESESGKGGLSLTEANVKLRQSKKGKLPIIGESGELVAMVSRRDLKKSREFRNASQDANKQLLVAAACPTSIHLPETLERVKCLVEAGVDALVLDAAQGCSAQQINFVKRVKGDYPNIDIVCGNVVTPRQAKPLLEAGADAIRVGMGCSSLYSSQEACAVGRPQGSAVYHVAALCRQYKIPCIADGGVRSADHIAMALTLGASTVMCGSLLAATEESPGEAFYHNGMRLKNYRGMVALEIMDRGEPPAVGAAGVGCAIVDRGSVYALVPSMIADVRKEVRRLGVSTIPDLHDNLYEKEVDGRYVPPATRFHIRTPGTYGAASVGLGIGGIF
jgi:IMP dehydrogenase